MYMRILHHKMDKIRLKRITWQLCYSLHCRKPLLLIIAIILINIPRIEL